MVARTVDLIGIEHIGIGSDLCQGHDDSVVTWMRTGRWSKETDYGEGAKHNPGWPAPVSWFRSNLDFHNVISGLQRRGFASVEVNQIMGGNWLKFFQQSFGPK